MAETAQSVQLSGLAGSLRRHWTVVATVALIGAVLGVAVAFVLPSTYESTATVAVNPMKANPLGASADAARSVSMPTEVGTATSAKVAAAAAKELDADYSLSAKDVREATRVESPDDSLILDIRFSGSSAEQAAAGANAVAKSYLAVRRADAQAQITRLKAATEQQIAAVQAQSVQPDFAGDVQQRSITLQADALGARLAELGGVDLTPGQVVGSAEVPGSPSTPGPITLGFAGLLLGLLVGVPLALRKKDENSEIGGVEGLQALGDQIVLDGTKDTNRADTWDIAAFMLKIPTDIGIEDPFLIMVDAEEQHGQSVTPGQELVDALSRRGRSARFVDAGAINEGKISRGWPTEKKRISWAGEIIVIDTSNLSSDANKVALATRSDSVLLARTAADDATALRRLAGLLRSKNVDIALTALFPQRPELLTLYR
ncbi:MAG: Wzz/FepE/Etk N-terminal domain-containing protein [Aeromicrobium sp.]